MMMKKKLTNIFVLLLAIVMMLAVSSCDLGSSPEESTGITPPVEAPLTEKTAEQVFTMVKDYFEYKSGDVIYNWVRSTTATSEEEDPTSTKEELFMGALGLGTDEFILSVGEKRQSMNAQFTYINGWAYTYVNEMTVDPVKMKQQMTPAEASDALVESKMGYKLPFSLSDFTSATVKIENNRYVLTLSGLTEAAYIREVLGLNDNVASAAKEYYTFSPENYTLTFTVKGTGALEAMVGSTSYTLHATLETTGFEGNCVYTITDEITGLSGFAARVPSDADTYVEVSDD